MNRHEQLRKQFDLISLRNKALSVAMALFNGVNDEEVLLLVGELLEQCSISNDRRLVEESFDDLIQLAMRYKLPFTKDF